MRSIVLLLAASLCCANLQAQVPHQITYQGYLTSPGGAPVNATVPMVFSFYNVGAGGAALYAETQMVTVANGVFTVLLGSAPPLPLPFDVPYYLGVKVGADPEMTQRQPVAASAYAIRSATTEALAPGATVPAGSLTGTIAIANLPNLGGTYIRNGASLQAGSSFNIDGNALVGGNVGIGTTNPQARMHIANASSSPGGLFVEATEGDRAAMYYGPDIGLIFDSFRPIDGRRLPLLLQPSGGTVGIGVGSPPSHTLGIFGGPAWTSNAWAGAVELGNASAIGWRTNAGGQRFGIGQSTGGLYFFHTASNPGTTGSPAVYDMQISDAGNVGIGKAPSAGIRLDVSGGVAIAPGNGVMQFGTPNAESGMSHIVAGNRSDLRFDGSTLKLVAGSTSGPPPATSGIQITTSGNVAIGTNNTVTGKLVVDGGSNNGVAGFGAGINIAGIYGASSTSQGFGVFGNNSANNAIAVYGQASGTNAEGVKGLATGGSSSIGVHGVGTGATYGIYGESQTGYAGYFSGAVHVQGNFSKSSGAFRIDHPLDRANKYLYHSFVESPDMMNIYNGNVTTDGTGESTIALPDYFEALNRDFRYQLTVIGQFAQAIVSSEVNDNRFSIRTDKPYVKVSWQVTGVRQDDYANEHRIQVEVDKPENERGIVLDPGTPERQAGSN